MGILRLCHSKVERRKGRNKRWRLKETEGETEVALVQFLALHGIKD